jgi:hypothetical protein
MKRFLLAVACFAVIASNPATARGGTNMHEMSSSRHPEDFHATSPSRPCPHRIRHHTSGGFSEGWTLASV